MRCEICGLILARRLLFRGAVVRVPPVCVVAARSIVATSPPVPKALFGQASAGPFRHGPKGTSIVPMIYQVLQDLKYIVFDCQ